MSAAWAKRSPKRRQQLSELDGAREKLRRIAQLHLERLGSDRDLAIVFSG
ncbi:MAG: hypothetical protein WKF84_16220 [Pyrinomonadaceae bacterium]